MNKRTIKTKKKMKYKVTARDMEKPRYFSNKMDAERFASRHDANGYGYPAWVEAMAKAGLGVPKSGNGRAECI